MRDPLLFSVAMLATMYIVVYLFRIRTTGHLASPSSLYAGLTCIHFSIPAIIQSFEQGSLFSNRDNGLYAVEAMIFAWLALIALQFGALFANSRLLSPGRLDIAKRNNAWSARQVGAVVIALLVAGWAARIHIIESNAYFQILRTSQGELEGPFYAAIRMAEQFPLYALCIVAVMYWRPGILTSNVLPFGLVIIIFSEVVYWLPSGRKEPLVLAFLLPLLIRYLRKGQLPSAKTVGALVLAVVLLFPAVSMYRNAMEVGGMGSNVVETVISAMEFAESGTVGSDKTSAEIIFGRMSLLESLSAAVRLYNEGDWEPMLGKSYAQALLSLVPRVFWPGKPDLHYGTDFGQAAGILSSGDWLTSISVTYYGEAFLNFGWVGLFVMLVMGILLGVLYKKATTSAHRETWLLVYVVALPTILYVGGTFALHFGGLLKLLPFFYLLGRFMESGASLPRSFSDRPAVQR